MVSFKCIPSQSFPGRQYITCGQNTSAKLLINEATSQENGSSGLYTVMPVPLHDEPGFVAIAFVLQEVSRQWGGRIRGISLDSACVFFQFPALLFQILVCY